MAKHPAVFLDRDGTLVEDNGYIDDISLVDFYPYTIEALEKLQESFLLFIITNQSGISKGLLSEDKVIKVNEHIENYLNENGITIYKTFYCPHQNEDNCICKKPKPHFINQAAEMYNLDLSKSFMVGDHPSDVECGINAGATPIYLLSGHGVKHSKELKHDVKVCKDLLEASDFILSTKNF